VLCPSHRTLELLARYVLSLARYDLNFDVRDRARMVRSLLAGVSSALQSDGDEELEGRGGVILRREQVRLVLFGGKGDVADDSSLHDDDLAMIGTMGAVTHKHMLGDAVLPDWLEKGIDSSLRDSEDDKPLPPPVYSQSSIQSSVPRNISSASRSPVLLTPASPSPAGSFVRQDTSKGPWTDLDKFYEDTNTDGDNEDEDDEDEEETESGGEEEEEEEDDEEEEEKENGDHNGSVEVASESDEGSDNHQTSHHQES